MRRRIHPLSPPALLAALLCLALWPRAALAHRLDAYCQLLKDRTVQVEGRYRSPSNPHPAGNAKVRVSRADGSTLAEGTLDAKGFFTFTYEQPEELKVVVSQTGHRAEVVLPLSFFGTADPADPPHEGTATPPSPLISSATDSTREQLKEALIAVSFLLALAAFVMSVRNARAMQDLKK